MCFRTRLGRNGCDNLLGLPIAAALETHGETVGLEAPDNLYRQLQCAGYPQKVWALFPLLLSSSVSA